MLGIGLGSPAVAQAETAAVPATPRVVVRLQSLTVAAEAPVTVVTRDGYTVALPPPPPPPPPPPAPPKPAAVAAAPTSGGLQWPVPPGTRISDGFGPRVAPCAGCSSFHQGVDFDAGNGAPVHAIAAGVVIETNSPGWSALGVHATIQHVIGGQVVVSVYGHMQSGSMTLAVGDRVTAGQVIGRVGSTGASTGPHLHFEIRPGGTTAVDPLAWMHARLG